MSRESRACGDLSKRLGDAPAGAAADGVKLHAGGREGRFSLLGPDANRGELRRRRVQCGLPIGALLAGGGKRGIQPSVLAARLSERAVQLGGLAARLSKRTAELGVLAARLSERHAKLCLLTALRGALRRQLRCLA